MAPMLLLLLSRKLRWYVPVAAGLKEMLSVLKGSLPIRENEAVSADIAHGTGETVPEGAALTDDRPGENQLQALPAIAAGFAIFAEQRLITSSSSLASIWGIGAYQVFAGT